MITVRKTYEVYLTLGESLDEEMNNVKECIEVSGEKIRAYQVEPFAIKVEVLSHTMDNRLGMLYPTAILSSIYPLNASSTN